MSSQQNVRSSQDALEYLLAEFRCVLLKAKLAQRDIEAVAIALKFGIVTPEQAVGMFWDSEAVHFLGLELGEGEAESAIGRAEWGRT
ncbi:MAG: hypothetical protein QOF94_2 [Acidobacteriaceae bacterium]|jgi:hypothetical protein